LFGFDFYLELWDAREDFEQNLLLGKYGIDWLLDQRQEYSLYELMFDKSKFLRGLLRNLL
jgi:hypothetical protein